MILGRIIYNERQMEFFMDACHIGGHPIRNSDGYIFWPFPNSIIFNLSQEDQSENSYTLITYAKAYSALRKSLANKYKDTIKDSITLYRGLRDADVKIHPDLKKEHPS